MMATKLTKKQIANNRMAYAIMAGIPAPRIQLSVVRADTRRARANVYDDATFMHTCGTSGCIAGWLSAHPYFQKQGLKINMANGVDLSTDWKLFGNSRIFDGGEVGIEGKRQALARLRKNLYEHGVITSARNMQLAMQEARMTK